MAIIQKDNDAVVTVMRQTSCAKQIDTTMMLIKKVWDILIQVLHLTAMLNIHIYIYYVMSTI